MVFRIVPIASSLLAVTMVLASLPTEQPTSRPEDASTTQPTSAPALEAKVEQLVRQLGARRFDEREAAQRELSAMGDEISALLIPHVTHKTPEIASRVAEILGTPRDSALRVELATKLILSTDTDWMERGVHMLFAGPDDSIELFMSRTKAAKGRDGVIFAPIREQIEMWQRMQRMFSEQYPRIREKSVEKAESLRKLHEESILYYAEAAYWGAHDALLDALEHPLPDKAADNPATSAPAE